MLVIAGAFQAVDICPKMTCPNVIAAADPIKGTPRRRNVVANPPCTSTTPRTMAREPPVRQAIAAMDSPSRVFGDAQR